MENRRKIAMLSGLSTIIILVAALFLNPFQSVATKSGVLGILVGIGIGLLGCIYLYFRTDPLTLRPKNNTNHFTGYLYLIFMFVGTFPLLLSSISNDLREFIGAYSLTMMIIPLCFIQIQILRNQPKYNLDKLEDLLEEFTSSRTKIGKRQTILKYPELVSQEAQRVLQSLIVQNEVFGWTTVPLEKNLTLLRRCREVGIEQAFDELE